MSLFPDVSPTPQEQAILDRSPLLSTFIDFGLVRTNIGEWGRRTNELKRPLRESLDGKISHMGADSLIFSFAVAMNELDLFSLDFEPQDKLRLATDLLLMGYEVGKMSDVDLFHTRILAQLIELEVISSEVEVRTRLGHDQSINMFRSIVKVGAYIAELEPHGGTQHSDELEVFQEFINGAEFKESSPE